MLNDPHSHGLWEVTAPPPPASGPLSGELAVDVAVIGAGYTGLSAALHLAEAGTSVALLEAREVGFGGAGRNVGLINAGMWVMPDELPKILGPEHGERALERLGAGPLLVRELIAHHAIACELETSGTLHCAVGAAGLREIEARCRQWQRRGAPVDLLSAAETARRIGTRAYSGALLDRRAGARLFTSTPVQGCARAGSRWKLTTPGGSVTAEWVIVASNFYTEGPWGALRTEQIELPYFNLATEPLGEKRLREILPGREGCWDTKTVLSSYRLDAAGRLVFGSVGALDTLGRPVHRAWGQRALRRLFPQLGEVEFAETWYGRIGMTPDALPRFHRLASHIVGYAGYNGRGISPGTVFGRELAQLVLGQLSEAELALAPSEPTSPGFRRAREFFYRTGSVLAHATGARF